MLKKTLTLFAGLLHCLLPASQSLPSENAITDLKPIQKGNCRLNCTVERFDEGKDCRDSGGKCNCIAHCCLAFDCRNWDNLVQCRRKCGVVSNKFGKLTRDTNCNKYVCEKHFYDSSLDSRGANDEQRNCVAHCCYALDCRRARGYCRQKCGVEVYVPKGLG